jgi:hypothetical protein
LGHSLLGHFWFNGGGLSSVRLFYCVEVDDYCGGVINGSGNERFCGRLKKDYAVQSHRAQKVLLQGNHLYIRAPRGEQVMSDNVLLDAEPLSVEAVAKMLELSKPIDLWITYFLSLANTTPREYVSTHERETLGSASTGSDWEEVGIAPSLEDFERAWANLRTPKRLKVGPLLASLVDTSPTGGAGLEILVEVDDLPEYATQAEREDYARDSLMIIVQEWGKVKVNFELLNSELATQGTSEMKFRGILASTIRSLQSVVHDSCHESARVRRRLTVVRLHAGICHKAAPRRHGCNQGLSPGHGSACRTVKTGWGRHRGSIGKSGKEFWEHDGSLSNHHH